MRDGLNSDFRAGKPTAYIGPRLIDATTPLSQKFTSTVNLQFMRAK